MAGAKKAAGEVPAPTTGYGYVGVWADGTLGWGLPDVIDGSKRRERPGSYFRTYAIDGDVAYLCRITIEPVIGKDGRPIKLVHKRRRLMPDPYTLRPHDSELAALEARRADDTARWAGVPAAPLDTTTVPCPRWLCDGTITVTLDVDDDGYAPYHVGDCPAGHGLAATERRAIGTRAARDYTRERERDEAEDRAERRHRDRMETD